MTTPMPNFAVNQAARVLAGFRGHYVTGSRAANAEEVAKGLPASFRVLNHLCAGGRIYKTYHGPDGHSYRSISQAKEHPNILMISND
tara:strand:- start:443 stop:703 length:261 start_codon:yes stop_codon:yes gene_type:complete